MECYPCRVWRTHVADDSSHAPNVPVATVGFVPDKCVSPPESIKTTDVIDIEIVYKWCTLETYDPHDILKDYPTYDGAEVWYNLLHTWRMLYIWRLVSLDLYCPNGEVQENGRGVHAPGDEFTWTFHGTIEELLGREITEPEDITLTWIFGYKIYGWVGGEYWPWEDALESNFLDPYGIGDYPSPITLSCTTHVELPPPPPEYPNPLFNEDLCSVSKETVAPDEEFDIKVTIENQNETSGEYYIGYYCKGAYGELATGTIDGLQTLAKIFPMTANELAGEVITKSQYLTYYIVTGYFEDANKRETDRWSPPALAVIVPPCTPGETKCVVYDLYTCNLQGEWELTKRNATECGYTPPSKIPWKWIGIGGGIAAVIGGIGLVVRKVKHG